MNDEIKDFLNEMDELTKQGVFGEQAKMYGFLKDKVDNSTLFYTVLKGWFEDKNQIGKQKVFDVISLLLELYFNGLRRDSVKTIEILSYFNEGIPGTPHSDIITPFYNWVTSLFTFKDSLPIGRSPGTKQQVIQNIRVLYQNGVEMVNKILLPLLCLKHLIRGDSYDPVEIFNLSLYLKTQRYVQIFEDKYQIVMDLIDRELRNAESHLNLRYSF